MSYIVILMSFTAIFLSIGYDSLIQEQENLNTSLLHIMKRMNIIFSLL
jgi:hypothetical protein